jgi:hypothetical protein
MILAAMQPHPMNDIGGLLPFGTREWSPLTSHFHATSLALRFGIKGRAFPTEASYSFRPVGLDDFSRLPVLGFLRLANRHLLVKIMLELAFRRPRIPIRWELGARTIMPSNSGSRMRERLKLSAQHQRLIAQSLSLDVAASRARLSVEIVKRLLDGGGRWRSGTDPKKLEAARQQLAQGISILKTAKLVGLGAGTVQRIKREMAAGA